MFVVRSWLLYLYLFYNVNAWRIHQSLVHVIPTPFSLSTSPNIISVQNSQEVDNEKIENKPIIKALN